MEATHPAIFQLNRFSIPKFSFEEPEANYSIVDVNFNPIGLYNSSNGDYKLTLHFKAIASTDKPKEEKEYKELIHAETEAYFILNEKPSFENIPDFFYSNSIAIIYPYIRAFVSNITLQSGLRLLVLPILNLNSLSETLKKQTTVLK
jgi:preprotein translocase subunit SecB